MADSPRERYRLERKISGKGSFGEIWLATDTLLDRPVVIKCPKATDDPIRRERFLVEARMLARLNHPNITQIYDAFFDEGEGNLYLVIEYVDGRDLAEIIGAGTPLPLDIVLEIATGILKALSYAHEQGLVHRDIKSANVMIADDVKLTDFGLASLQSILKRGIGFVAGTPAYMAPEQIEGRAIDGRADLYALGVLLFEVISGGRLPFEYTDNDAMLDAHLHVAPPPLSQFAPMVPPVLEQVVARLLVKEPEERYPSAGAVLEVLDSIQVGPKVGNLPVSLTPFVGREAELAGIQERLKDPDCRLLTLVGLGGSGKTRLALEAAATQADDYPDGVFFVPLASLESVEGIVPTVAEALGFRFYEESEPRQQLLDYLRQKHMLIILDNFEQLVEGVGLVTDILQTAPGVKILDTSRIRLNVQGEHLFPVAGMEFPGQEKAEDAGWDAALRRAPQPVDQPALTASPGDGQDVAQYSAVKLFLQSARRVQPSFELTIDDILDVAHICALVDGMPLAILLATAWTEIMTPAEIKGQIRQSLDFLETNLRDVPPRQRSMRVVFDHSWNLLTEREREVFAGLSVFRGGFTRDAAQKVSDASLRDLMALVHKSLLHPTASGRYDMHQLLRVYAAEKLEILGETEVAREAHTAYYAEFLFQREEDLKGRRQLEALDEIEVDFENARTAWNWALKCKNFTAIGQSQRSLSWFCTFRSRSQEHKELLQRAREQLAPGPSDEPHPVWGRNLVAESYLGTDDFDIGQIERVLAIAQKFGDLDMMTVCTRTLGRAALDAYDYPSALSFFEESLAIAHKLEDSFNVAAALFSLAETYRLLGQPDKAITYARQSLALSREIGDRFWAASSLVNTGIIAFYTGNYTEAEGYHREANTMYREIGYKAGIAESCMQMGRSAFVRGDFEDANSLTGEALQIATDIGNKRVAESARYLYALVATAIGERAHTDRDQEELAPKADIPTTLDRFEIKGLLGVGSLGTVYWAHDPEIGRDVAIKVANPEALKRFDWLGKRFKREAETMSKLSHTAIPECYAYVEAGDQIYMVLEYLEGKDLEAILQESEGFIPQEDVIEWSVQVCDALIHLHNQEPEPYVFRDVKPSNVTIGPDAQVHLIDLGTVEAYQPGRELPNIGTEGYSPPEQYIGYSDVRSDVYALGATLHHLLTRRDPRKSSPFSFREAPPRALNPSISEELEGVIIKAVEHNPEDRYQSVEEMKTALLTCL